MGDEEKNAKLRLAARNGQVDVLKEMIAAGADKDWVRPGEAFGTSALHLAASRGRAECIQILCDAGAAVDKADKQGSSALHYAAEQGSAECVEILVKAGADVSMKGEGGHTPLELAKKKGKHEAAAFLEKVHGGPSAGERTTATPAQATTAAPAKATTTEEVKESPASTCGTGLILFARVAPECAGQAAAEESVPVEVGVDAKVRDVIQYLMKGEFVTGDVGVQWQEQGSSEERILGPDEFLADVGLCPQSVVQVVRKPPPKITTRRSDYGDRHQNSWERIRQWQ